LSNKKKTQKNAKKRKKTQKMFEALASFVFSLFLLLNGPSRLGRNSKTIPGEVTVKLYLLIVVQSEAL
jgi:hypothetical protein